MRNRIFPLLLGASALAFGQFGQPNSAQQNLAHKIDFPHDAPVSLAGDEWGGSAATVRGGAYAIDVRVALSLRNASQRRIRGITLTVLAQEATPGGKGSISVPSLDVAAGRNIFSARRFASAAAHRRRRRARWSKLASTASCSTTSTSTVPTSCIRGAP